MDEFEEHLENIRQHILDASNQNWLFGAGISRDANIPLMYPLTDRVCELVDCEGSAIDKTLISALKNELPEDCHVEHYLSHLGDLIALAERTKNSSASVDGNDFTLSQLDDCYRKIVEMIGTTVRYGYKDSDNVGTQSKPIVEIDGHIRFVKALFSNKANLERRTSISFFTTNYDTLLEDALALNKLDVVDGFSGGAMAFWNAKSVFQIDKSGSDAKELYKLHGSVDWHRVPEHGLVRVRYGTKYLPDAADIMIYPQSTKYVETQKDPFSTLFAGLRNKLKRREQNVLISCGYSYGDEHINAEIESCLSENDNKTTVVAFIEEKPSGDNIINPTLDKWLLHPQFGERIFVAGKNGVYVNSLSPALPEGYSELDWWTFSGLTSFIENGDLL